ncbi:DUF995 domain-containing protein [Paraburkholderia sp.]|uniref:DUF995 domain-containing protein n=1 Tax=Paraburkholderia sp. TaxID=1926495 RepID=UPI003D6F2B85
MTRSIKFLFSVASLLASAAFAQTAQPDPDAKQHLSGAHFSTTSPSGSSTEVWVSDADGAVVVTRRGALGSKASSSTSASGHWSVNDTGQYCLHVEWDVRQGGPEDWCAPVAVGDDGATTLTLADGRKVAVSH